MKTKKSALWALFLVFLWEDEGFRTLDPQNHNLML